MQGWAWLIGAKRSFDMPMRGELPAIVARSDRRASPARAFWSRLTTAVSNPQLQIVAAFCIIGILLTLNVALRFPEFGAVVAELDSFP